MCKGSTLEKVKLNIYITFRQLVLVVCPGLDSIHCSASCTLPSQLAVKLVFIPT
jgi:hypothetical protein